MASRPRLDGIPMEIMENIVTLLAFSDICSLRLTGCKVSAKSSGGFFKSHFRNKTITMSSSEQLHEAVSMTQRQGFGCLLENLTLVGLSKSCNPKDAAVLLGQAMKNLRLGLAGGCLPSLSLVIEDGVEYDGKSLAKDSNSWKSVWETAGECFEATMQALSASELPVESLDVFSGVTCCSLSLDRLVTIQELNLSASLQRLKRLSMSLSHHMVCKLGYRSEESEEMQALTSGERYTMAICKFLQNCSPVLENLSLHWYKLRTINLSNAISEEVNFFDRVAQWCQFPLLKRCTLKGIVTSEASLLSFLRQMQLNSIEMEEIHLHSGNFLLVFHYLVNHMEKLEHVHLSDLWENHELIYFDAPGEPHFPGTEPQIGPNTLIRAGDDSHMPIEYEYKRGFPVHTPRYNIWARKRGVQYGPPPS
ncbi:hypothetical protein V495_08553 [Pseudogymnoascus sp. VKM F-4514 (FW-929)]|nr:hypothetical protein V495_08553 [Pseudogymnoascus sp. VKM F-4514 (FW-929)]KFY52032.1 hypothetical protein V497_08688 [Pseudogymnoascus sp. VKM F-4516 (FW-969)]